jgi:hypothetical protein
MMVAAAENEVPMAAIMQERPWAEHWLAPAFARNLRDASLGKMPNSLPKNLRNSFANAVASVKGRTRLKGEPIQRLSYAAIATTRFKFDMAGFIVAKANRLFGADFPKETGLAVVRVLARSSPQVFFLVLRVVTNGWTTSARFQEVLVGPCLFGCLGGLDDLEHYLECQCLHVVVAQAFGERIVREPSAARFGFCVPPGVLELWRAAVLSEVYLVVKGSPKSPDRHLPNLMLQRIASAAVHKVRPLFPR